MVARIHHGSHTCTRKSLGAVSKVPFGVSSSGTWSMVTPVIITSSLNLMVAWPLWPSMAQQLPGYNDGCMYVQTKKKVFAVMTLYQTTLSLTTWIIVFGEDEKCHRGTIPRMLTELTVWVWVGEQWFNSTEPPALSRAKSNLPILSAPNRCREKAIMSCMSYKQKEFDPTSFKHSNRTYLSG